MNYEEKYKQAFRKALDLYNQGLINPPLEHIFPELKASKDERIRKAIIEFIELQDDNTTYSFIPKKDILAWLEKQGENKSVDKPKFKVGDWILNDVCFPLQIASIRDGMYVFTEGDAISVSFVDEHLHLWTIQDAMDGDVLINWNNTTFIFKAIEDETVKFHIAYNEKWDTIKTPSTKLSHLGLPEPQFEFHPATKEQRDLLFQKMKLL